MDATVNLNRPDQVRAEIEARRGIVRDSKGRIVRTQAWKDQRKVKLQEKKVTLLERLAAVDRQLKELD